MKNYWKIESSIWWRRKIKTGPTIPTFLEQLSISHKILGEEIKFWLGSRKHLRREHLKYGIFEPSTTMFSVDLTALGRSAQTTSSRSIFTFQKLHQCTLPRNQKCWSNRTFLENVQHLHIDIRTLSRYYKFLDPAQLLFLPWAHLEKSSISSFIFRICVSGSIGDPRSWQIFGCG